MSDVRLVSGEAALTVSVTSGGRLGSLQVGDLELLGRGGSGIYHWGCFPMAPFAGRVRRGRLTWGGSTYQLPITFGPHAIHGVVVDRAWTVEEVTAESARLSCPFDSRWPWAGHAVAAMALSAQRLDVTMEVHADAVPMPAWTGYHPWFRRQLSRGEPARLDFTVEGMLRRDDDGIPTGEVVPRPEGPWDECFTGATWPATLTWDGALQLRISSDADYVVVFDQHEGTVCVEPQTGPPDAVALGREAVVEPGRPLVLHMSWEWSPA
jgi:galactose mutarotase-like enzyme